jgi:ABC-type lipoprotein release transport system permease subunit
VARSDVERFFAQHPAVDEATIGALAPFPNGVPLTLGDRREPVQLVVLDAGLDAVQPAIIDGRAPEGRDEIALGEATLADQGLRIGDTVRAHGQAGTWDEPGDPMSSRFEVVGTAVGFGGGDEGLGRAAYLTLDGAAVLNPQMEPQSIFVRLTRGADMSQLAADYATRFAGAELLPIDAVLEPTNTLDIESVDAAPLVLAGIVALMAAGVLVHLLISSVHAHRRRLAVLAALGLRPAQIRRVVAWQSTLVTALALALGVPIGIALGRLIWFEYAQSLHVVRVTVMPWLAVAVIVPTGLVLANVAALVPAWRVSRATPATVLRTE